MFARDITQRTVLRVLISGFGLVLLLLGVAGVVGVRGTREIQDDAEQLVREELIIARLLNEVQAEEATLTAVLHEVVLGETSKQAGEILLRQLAQAEAGIQSASKAAQRTREAARWRQLETSIREFAATASKTIRGANHSDATLQNLLALHAAVIANVRQIVTSSTERATRIDDVLAGRSHDLASESFALLGSCFLLSLVCAGLTVRMAFNSIRRIEWQAAELTQVSWQMVRTQEEAARRFSHELHDELGQSLAAIKANLTGMRADDFDLRRTDCIQVVDNAIGNVRELSQLLRPVMLDDFGLDAALRWLGEKFSERTGIHVDYENNLEGRLSDETETHLFRIAQEALTNVARHSAASQVRIRLRESREDVALTIADNGRGLMPSPVQKGPSLGMVGMRARARQIGGELRVSTPQGGGLEIAVEVPRVTRKDEFSEESSSPAGR